jgi:hypothetical protein
VFAIYLVLTVGVARACAFAVGVARAALCVVAGVLNGVMTVLVCVVLIPCVMNGVMNHVYRCEQCARNPYDSALVLGVIALGLLFDLFVLLSCDKIGLDFSWPRLFVFFFNLAVCTAEWNPGGQRNAPFTS